jgi:hypothetical protein
MLRNHALAAIVAAGALGAGFAMPSQANAMPMVTVQPDGLPLIMVRNGCGRGWHLNRWGRCVVNHPYRPYAYYGWYGPRYYYGWYHRPHYWYWRHHHHHHHHHHWRHHYYRSR